MKARSFFSTINGWRRFDWLEPGTGGIFLLPVQGLNLGNSPPRISFLLLVVLMEPTLIILDGLMVAPHFHKLDFDHPAGRVGRDVMKLVT